MLRIAIVEDEDRFAEELNGYLARFEEESGRRLSVSRFRDGEEISGEYEGGFDIILMDIQMPLMDGMKAAEKIRETDPEVIIIFITNRTDYAIRGYQVDALDYVLKPINYISFAQKMTKAVGRLQNREEKRITINTRNGMLRMGSSSVYYVESQGHNITWHTAIGDYTVRDRMQDIESALLPHGFFRSNKGYLVNLRHVEGIQDGCCLVHGDRLLISRGRKAEFLAALTKYMGEN